MNPPTRFQHSKLLFGAIAMSLLSAAPASADILGPYVTDANTLHLWHLDEADPGPAASVGNGNLFSLMPTNGAILGAPAFAGFGTAADTTAATNTGFSAPTVSTSDLTGADGAFTFEAMVRTSSSTAIQQIVSLENAGGVTARPFQFRIDEGQLRFINIAGAAGVEQILTLIPTTGPDAFVPDEWFHAAVTYNGNENTADNIKLYWTRVDASRTQANEILSMTMVADLGVATAPFGVGNEFRQTPDNNFLGQIDEVRISDIARAPDGMLFGTIGPDLDPPLLLDTTPADDAVDVLVSADLVASFNEIIAAGTGEITLWKNADPDELVETFDVTSSSQLTFGVGTLTIDPTDELVGGVEYYVLVDATAIQDATANTFAGISDPSDWSFTTDGTAPTGTAMGPMADATEVSPKSGLTLSFSETVQAGAGTITIHLAGDDSVAQEIDVTSSAVTIDGTEVTIALSQLAGATAYYVNIPAGAFRDPSGNVYDGITDTSTWAFTTAVIPEGLLFSQDFAGSSADLDTGIPDTTIGGTAWVASPNFNQDGSIDQGAAGAGAGSATLAFTPFNGLVYTLEASITGISGNGNWFALGFANGQSTGSSPNDRFITGNVVGTAWMLMKGDASTSQNSAFLGLGTFGGGNHGLTSNEAWTVWTTENPGGDIDLRIVLDTTGGPNTWTATWYAKRPADASYTEVRPTAPMLTESINAVGLALANAGVFGTIESFRLYTGAPPADTLVLEIAANGGLLDFAWNSKNGMQYDLVSSLDPATGADPSLWAPYNDGVNPAYEDIPASGTGSNTLTGVVQTGAVRFFALTEEPVPPLLAENFEELTGPAPPAGWSRSDNGAGTAWEVGAPSGAGTGPDAAASGTQCAGTNIGADYTASAEASLVTDAFTVPATGATLSFRQYIDTDLTGVPADVGSIRLLNAGDGSPLAGGDVTTNIEGATEQWSRESIALPAAANGLNVKLEFRFVSNASNEFAGFYIDDVVVTGN